MVGVASGQRLHELANGIDPRRVEVTRVEKSVGHETTFAVDLTERTGLESVLLDQSHRVAARLRSRSMLTRTVAIKVRFADFRTISRSRGVDATDVAHEVFTVARELLDRVDLPPAGVRLLGVRAENLVAGSDGVQLQLGGGDQRREAESAMDAVRQRFGTGALRPAALLDASAGGSAAPATDEGDGRLSPGPRAN
jgi:DNA polymerase-4